MFINYKYKDEKQTIPIRDTKYIILQDVLFYLVSDDVASAKPYLFTEENKKFNIVLPYDGVPKVSGKIYT